MEPLKLTKEQKDKLFEMCRELFPEYVWQDGTFFREGHLDIYDKGTKLCPDWLIYKDSVHWFEFCMTRLINKIFYPDGNGKRNTRKEVEYFFFQTFVDAVEGATSGYNHPIDFLYEKFKSQAKT